ncbi:hypothetical protein [Nonomuraea sp. NPDC048916]
MNPQVWDARDEGMNGHAVAMTAGPRAGLGTARPRGLVDNRR